MSAASDYGVAVVDRLIIPSLNTDDRNVFSSNEPLAAVGDVLAYLFHWLEAQIANPGDGGDEESVIDDAIETAKRHWRAERGDGDDIAQDSEEFYLNLIKELP